MENKITTSITLHRSIMDEVKKRREGISLSSLIENLLINWCEKTDRLLAIEKKLDALSDEDLFKKIQQDYKKEVLR